MGSAFLRDTLDNLVEAGREAPIDPFVAYAPAGEEARFDGMLPPSARLLLANGSQGEAPGVQGFGRVLLDTTRTLLARGYGAVCVLGADSPTLPTRELVRAARLLLDGTAEAVLGPADDGGYWLLGLTRPHPEPYADITWSSETVADETRARCVAAGLRLVELETWYDVDDRAALTRLVRETAGPSHDAAQPYAAPHTAAAIARFGLVERLAGTVMADSTA